MAVLNYTVTFATVATGVINKLGDHGHGGDGHEDLRRHHELDWRADDRAGAGLG